jgi:hypothetical protein
MSFMKTTLERLPNSRVKFSVSVPKEKLQAAVEHAYTALADQVEVKGFRKGQAPKAMIFDTVGSARLREVILERLLPDTYYAGQSGSSRWSAGFDQEPRVGEGACRSKSPIRFGIRRGSRYFTPSYPQERLQNPPF